MLEDGLVSLMNADTGVNGLLAGRVYPVQGVPDNPTYPYLTYQDITGSSEYTFDGAEARSQRLQFDAWGQRYSDCKTILKALRKLFSGYAGALNEGTAVLFCKRLNEMDDFGEDQRVYRSIAEYEFEISEV